MLGRRADAGQHHGGADQNDTLKAAAFEVIGHHAVAAADIMQHRGRAFQVPIEQEVVEDTSLPGIAHIHAVATLGLALARKVVDEHPMLARERRRYVSPDVGIAGKPVHEHQRKTLAQHVVSNLHTLHAHAFRQLPLGHRKPPSPGPDLSAGVGNIQPAKRVLPV